MDGPLPAWPVAKFLVPDWHRVVVPARQPMKPGRPVRQPMPESTRSPSKGLRIWFLDMTVVSGVVSVTIGSVLDEKPIPIGPDLRNPTSQTCNIR